MSSSQPGEEAADLNRKLATEILKTRLGFSDDHIHRLIISDNMISHIIALGFPTEEKENFDLFPNMANCEEAADLNRNITTEILKTKLGFSNDEIHRLIGDEISIMLEGKIMDKIVKIPTDEILAIAEAEIYKLPFSKRIRLVKAFIVQEYPFAKFLVSLFMRTNPREEEDDKEPVPSAVHHFSAPLPPQQTHRFPLSIVVPLGITFVFGAICFITSKLMTKGGHLVTPAIDVAQDLQLVETDNQVGSVEAISDVTSNCSLNKCVAALEEIQDIPEDTYGKALKKFMNPDSRKMFIAMSNESKREWLLQL